MIQGNYRREEMVAELKRYGQDHGFAVLGTAVVVVGPGAPFTVHSTWYAAKDLEEAARAGALQMRRLSGSFTLDIYAIPTDGGKHD